MKKLVASVAAAMLVFGAAAFASPIGGSRPAEPKSAQEAVAAATRDLNDGVTGAIDTRKGSEGGSQ